VNRSTGKKLKKKNELKPLHLSLGWFCEPYLVGYSPYSIMVNPSILSKCFLFKVAKGKLFEIAVAAINRSARSISFLFLFKGDGSWL
jgi:hypothetical protein